MVNQWIASQFGMTIMDLPDTIDLCNLYDEVEALLEDGEVEAAGELIIDTVDYDFIKEVVYS